MKILIIHRKGLFETQGGEQDQVRYFQSAMQDLGVEVELSERIPDRPVPYDLVHFFGLCEDHITEIEKAEGIPLVLTPVFWDRAQGYLLANEFEEWPRPGRERPDRFSYWIRRVFRKKDRRLMKFCRFHFFEDLARYAAFQRVINRIGLFLPNSEAEMSSLTTFYVFDQKPNFRVVPNAVNIEALKHPSDFSEKRLSGLSPFICCSACFDRRKNQYSLVKALLDVDIPLVFMGGVRQKKYFESVQRLALRRKNIHFLGHLDPPDLHSVYRSASVHALPSFHDTPGITNLEAVAHECVNVGTQIGGLREYLGNHSLYCNPFSVDHIREKVLEALELPPNKQGAEKVLASYTYEQASKATIQAYRQYLEGLH